VPKYDAFGREFCEDTLAGLAGESESGGATAAPAGDWTEAQLAAAAEAPAPELPVTPQPAPAPPPPQQFSMPQPTQVPSFDLPAPGAPVVHVRRRSGLGCFVGLVIMLAVVAAPIALVVFSAGDAIDEITDAIDSVPDITVPEPPAEPEQPAKPPVGVSGRSMVAPGNLRKALRRLDRARLGRVTLLRLSPDRVDAQLVKGGRQRSAQVDFEGDLVRGPASPGGTGLSAIALEAIDVRAPARLVRGSAARYKVRERGIDYLVLMPDPIEGHRWTAYFKNRVYVQGDRSGRVVRRIN